MTVGNIIEVAKSLISFYNMQEGTRYRLGDDENRIKVFTDAIERAEGMYELKNHIRQYIGSKKEGRDILDCFESFKRDTQVQPETQTASATAPTSQQVNNSLGILEQALIEVIKKQSIPQIETDIKAECEQMLKDFIKQEYGTIERKVITVLDGKKVELEGVQHEKFDTVLKFVRNNEPVFLTGPAGSGKNELCKQVAKALDLDFYFTNAVTQEYKLTGFTDANGRYQETQFYKAFTKGGLFMLDEMDASIPEVLVILNAAIANGYFDFPAPIGYVEANPNFRVIAAGNTLGHGADTEYIGRNQLDGASLDRFAVVRIDYSRTIEDAMAQGNTELADFCREYRKIANEAGLAIIVSYRAIKRLAKMVQLLTLTEALDTCLTKGIGRDDLNIITAKLSDSKYKRAMQELARVA